LLLVPIRLLQLVSIIQTLFTYWTLRKIRIFQKLHLFISNTAWWNEELDHLKTNSTEAHEVWESYGKSRYGQVFNLRHQAKPNIMLYKRTDEDLNKTLFDRIHSFHKYKRYVHQCMPNGTNLDTYRIQSLSFFFPAALKGIHKGIQCTPSPWHWNSDRLVASLQIILLLFFILSLF